MLIKVIRCRPPPGHPGLLSSWPRQRSLTPPPVPSVPLTVFFPSFCSRFSSSITFQREKSTARRPRRRAAPPPPPPCVARSSDKFMTGRLNAFKYPACYESHRHKDSRSKRATSECLVVAPEHGPLFRLLGGSSGKEFERRRRREETAATTRRTRGQKVRSHGRRRTHSGDRPTDRPTEDEEISNVHLKVGGEKERERWNGLFSFLPFPL